jgi:cytochrome c-type biogenesis protein CcmE
MSTHTESLATSAPKRGGIPFGYIVIALIAAGIVVLLVTTASGGRYELEVGQVVTAPEKYLGKSVRVRGQIKDGSIFASVVDGRPLTRFTVVDEHGHELPIVSHESPPDNFEGGKSCIVEGRYSEEGHVESTRLTMKCPSKYEAEGQTPGSGAGGLYEQYKTAPKGTGPRS